MKKEKMDLTLQKNKIIRILIVLFFTCCLWKTAESVQAVGQQNVQNQETEVMTENQQESSLSLYRCLSGMIDMDQKVQERMQEKQPAWTEDLYRFCLQPETEDEMETEIETEAAETEAETEQMTESEVMTENQTAEELQEETTLQPEDAQVQEGVEIVVEMGGISYSDYLFVGDSRTEGMNQTCSNGYGYIAAVSAGYSWLSSDCDASLRQQLNANPEQNVIFGFGVNDPGNINQYIAYYQQIQADYPQTNFWFLSVNPVDFSKSYAHGYQIGEGVVENFNAQLQAVFPGQYLDSYSHLLETGFCATDGIHYDGATYQEIQNYVIGAITGQ